jgi:hypothetical protein
MSNNDDDIEMALVILLDEAWIVWEDCHNQVKLAPTIIDRQVWLEMAKQQMNKIELILSKLPENTVNLYTSRETRQ